jgi:alpha-L-rhamnosidase
MSIVTKLRCEYMENPLGIDVQIPRISWQIQSEARKWLQAAYQIQVASEASRMKLRNGLKALFGKWDY